MSDQTSPDKEYEIAVDRCMETHEPIFLGTKDEAGITKEANSPCAACLRIAHQTMGLNDTLPDIEHPADPKGSS